MISEENGFTLIEVLVAATVVAVGIVGSLGALDAGRLLSLVAERNTAIAHRSQQEIERIEAMPYNQVALAAAPPAASGCPAPLTPSYPTSPDCYVAGASFLYDRKDTTKSEPLVVDATNGSITPNSASSGCTDGCTAKWRDGNFSGEIFTFVTWASDPNCSSGSICQASNDYKRVTVIVTLSGVSHPSTPALVSTLIADPNAAPKGAPANSAQNPLQSPTTLCGGSTCNQALNGSPLTYYLTDTTSTAGGGYQPPTGPNNLHQTITNFACGLGLCSPAPDLVIPSLPSTGGRNPPCFSQDIGCVASGGTILKRPATDSSTCGNPPLDNTRSHTWVTSAFPAGTTVHLTGGGGMTAFLQSANGATATVTVCLALYIVPNSAIGTLNLLQTPIGAAVSAQAQVSGSGPTPISFGFSTGQAATLTSTLLNQARLEFVMWVAASGGTDVDLVYDHPSFSSQVTVVEQ